MEYFMILSCFFSNPNVWDLFSLITGVVALIISFGFLFRPRIKFCVSIFNKIKSDSTENTQIHVKLFNCNKYRKVLTDIKCEMSISKDFTGTVKTLELWKDTIVCLLRVKEEEENPNYVFITKNYDQYKNIEAYKYLKTKFLIPNFLGIKKAYEFVVLISDLKDKKCISVTPKNPSKK